MPVPDYQKFMLPLLTLASDGEEHRLADAIDSLAIAFGLTEEERRELLPSGRQARFANRVGWARTYLSEAGLIESTGRGTFRLTQRGRALLDTKPTSVSTSDLEQYPEYLAFKTSDAIAKVTPETLTSAQTPDELMQSSHQQLMASLAEDLLQEVKKRSPEFFENLVIDLLVRMGYGGSRAEAGTRIGRSGDGGIDGIIKEDKLGLDVVCIQAKRWEGSVGRPIVQAFAGSLEGNRAKKGVLITTSQFTLDALDYANRIEKRMVLIDGKRLVEYMIESGLGVASVAEYTVYRIALDEIDYFDEERLLQGTVPMAAGETIINLDSTLA